MVKSDLAAYGEEKVLGLKWLNTSNKLAFNAMSSKINKELYSGDKCPTKREFLSVIMSVSDPLEFLAPFMIQSSILLQRICSSGIEWDEPLLGDDFTMWKQWLRDLEQVKMCQIERCYQREGYSSDALNCMYFAMQARELLRQ